MCKENEKWLHFQFEMSKDDNCEKCPRAEKNNNLLVTHVKAERSKEVNKNWERFLSAFRHIGCSTFGSIDACGLTMDQVDTATAMFNDLGYAVERHFLTSKDDRMVYWVFLYYTKTKS
jgi:hypothetical protein